MHALAEEHGIEGLTPVLVAMKFGYLKDSLEEWERCTDA